MYVVYTNHSLDSTFQILRLGKDWHDKSGDALNQSDPSLCTIHFDFNLRIAWREGGGVVVQSNSFLY
jgi:hypothetical protein